MSQHTTMTKKVNELGLNLFVDGKNVALMLKSNELIADAILEHFNAFDEMRLVLCDLYSYMDGYLPNDRNVNLTKYMENARAILKKTGEGK